MKYIREREILYSLYVESKKQNKQMNIRNRLTDIENKLVVTSGEKEVGSGKTGKGIMRLKTARYK